MTKERKISSITRLKHMFQAGEIRRVHTHKHLQHYTVATHTFNMLVIADFIYDGDTPPELAKAILYHDLHESLTGDIPYPVRSVDPVREAYNKLEKATNEYMQCEVELSDELQEMLKIIDKLEFLWFVLNERLLGNTTLDSKFNYCIGLLYDYNKPPRVQQLLDHIKRRCPVDVTY